MPKFASRFTERLEIVDDAVFPEAPVTSREAATSAPPQRLPSTLQIAGKHPVGSPSDRRRRWRAKLTGRVHIRGSVDTIDAFEEVAKTVDVSRDGLLLVSPRGGYWVGQPLEVTFPYWTVPTAINQARRATVVRNVPLKTFCYEVAIQFDSLERDESKRRGNHGQVKILAIEPDRQMAQTIRNLLENDGYDVVVIKSGNEAMEILKTETPDVLLAGAETRTGDPTGRDICRLVKSTQRLQHIPVILLTSSAMPSDYSANRRAGAVMCIPMPCDPERLQRSVHLVAPPPGHRSAYSAGYNVASFVRTGK